MSWDEYFLAIAAAVAMKSKDPSTTVGCVIVGPSRNILTTGYNGLPRGVEDTHDRLHNRDIKYAMIAHAERNAIDQRAPGISLAGATLYATMAPCHECAKSIIQAGISEVVAPALHAGSKWHESATLARIMFDEAGVEYRTVSQ